LGDNAIVDGDSPNTIAAPDTLSLHEDANSIYSAAPLAVVTVLSLAEILRDCKLFDRLAVLIRSSKYLLQVVMVTLGEHKALSIAFLIFFAHFPIGTVVQNLKAA